MHAYPEIELINCAKKIQMYNDDTKKPTAGRCFAITKVDFICGSSEKRFNSGCNRLCAFARIGYVGG